MGSWMQGGQTGEYPTHVSWETQAPPQRAWRLGISWTGLFLAFNLRLGVGVGFLQPLSVGRETCSLGLFPPPEPGWGSRKAEEEGCGSQGGGRKDQVVETQTSSHSCSLDGALKESSSGSRMECQ